MEWGWMRFKSVSSAQFTYLCFSQCNLGFQPLSPSSKQGMPHPQAFLLSGHTPYSLFSFMNSYSYTKPPLKLPSSVKTPVTSKELAHPSIVILHHPI